MNDASRPCAGAGCTNTARLGRALCHRCSKRRQRESRRFNPHYTSPWERLVAAAIRLAWAEGEDEYLRAEHVLRKAALEYRKREPLRLAPSESVRHY